ncbi:uncharacterized protein DUF2637 [Haloactinopolyspora alba]|uniref:Uncharacterized protein DUF2637 n=1 Tax=Haloactinopolyspora alba TaxID=648780 RepID=A0A2P8EFD0_9ACTN|nr:DUF2637 domain-containing protein [Haloactinopolyspora alba]PSL08144.1 uncharacterized protein DUF2637 [Haloactinopolyspora alba]
MSTEPTSATPGPVSAPSSQVADLSDAPSVRAERDHQPPAARTEPVSAHEQQASSRATLRRLITMIAVVGAALAIGAFTLSFDALRELATISGLNPTLAWLWPLIVDGFILIATAAAVALRDRGRRVTWYPWATLILFSTISVAGNALHASNHAHHTAVSITIAAAVSAVPALALLLASHLMVVLLSTPNHTTGHEPTRTSHECASTSERPAEGTAHAVERPSSAATSASSLNVTSSTTAKETKPTRATVDAELRAWIHGEHAAGRTVTGADVAARLNVSAATGRRRLAALRQEMPADAPDDSSQGLSHGEAGSHARAERS